MKNYEKNSVGRKARDSVLVLSVVTLATSIVLDLLGSFGVLDKEVSSAIVPVLNIIAVVLFMIFILLRAMRG